MLTLTCDGGDARVELQVVALTLTLAQTLNPYRSPIPIHCQFRALADQLLGSQQHHAVVRAAAVAHMRAASNFFGMFFEDAEELSSYLSEMSLSRTWGDELTLRASVEAFGCVAHVVTSEDANWYLGCISYIHNSQPKLDTHHAHTYVHARMYSVYVHTYTHAYRYLVYTPEAPPPDAVAAIVTKHCTKHRLDRPPASKEVFINYISPIHYNAVAPLA